MRELYLGLFAILLWVPQGRACDLFWNNRQSLGYEQGGTQLQVCCNVSSVQIWSLSNSSSFSVQKNVLDKKFESPSEEMWADQMQLSICSDRSEPTIGWVGARPGVTCDYKTVQTMDITPGSLTMPGWYIICYRMNDGCQTCSLEAICDNDLSTSCAEVYMAGSSSGATNETIDYWIVAGSRFPFTSTSKVELTVTDQRTRQQVSKETLQPKSGSQSRLTLLGLSPNHVYNIRRCLVVSLPSSIRTDSRFSFPANESRFCVEESFRTLRGSAHKSKPLLLIVLLSLWSL